VTGALAAPPPDASVPFDDVEAPYGQLVHLETGDPQLPDLGPTYGEPPDGHGAQCGGTECGSEDGGETDATGRRGGGSFRNRSGCPAHRPVQKYRPVPVAL
jgi:hypothetical protein